jgi:hypothetical protein
MSRRVAVTKLLNRLAGSPWVLSSGSFVVTALLIRSNSFNLL